jgi:hypothetical protein
MRGLALSVSFALASIWVGVTAAYLIPTLPPSSAIIGVAVAIHAAAFAGTGYRHSPQAPWRTTS